MGESDELLYQALVEQALPDAMFVHDHQGRFVQVNERACRSVGYSRDELLAMCVFDLDQTVDLEQAQVEWDRIQPGVTVVLQGKHHRKDGSTFPVEVHFGLVRVDPHRLYVGLVRDVTERELARAQIADHVIDLERANEETLLAVAKMVELRDPYTAGHERRVGLLAEAIGSQMGLDDTVVANLRRAGYVHDIGKIGVPAEILSKPMRLTEAEFLLVKGHPDGGYQILKDISLPWPLADIVRQHHERLDGSGYPSGLVGEDILLESRILGVADVVEAMSSHRPYRPGLGIDAALQELEQNAGRLYDPEVVEACLRVIRGGYAIEPESPSDQRD